jgi:cell division septum initiation protein DivIVA
MSVEPHTDVGAEQRDLRRPNVAGDLPSVLQAGPMFRRALAGYDRFQVDTYVRWAEDELASADREREDLVARHLRTRAALDDARQLLTHSAGGAEFLQLSRRIGSMLAAAADEAEGIRTEAEACRATASLQAERLVAQATQVVADAQAEAARMLAEARGRSDELVAEAGRLVVEAELTGQQARVEAEARLEKVRAIELRAAEQLGQLRQQALDEAAAARLHARHDVVSMFEAAREERRRADAAATVTRERLDAESATRVAAALAEVKALRRRRSSLRSEIRAMERQRSALQAEVEMLSARAARASGSRLDLHLRRLVEPLRWRSRSVRLP